MRLPGGRFLTACVTAVSWYNLKLVSKHTRGDLKPVAESRWAEGANSAEEKNEEEYSNGCR